MESADIIEDIKKLPIEKKFQMLSEIDKAYLNGYIDRAMLEQQKKEQKKQKNK
jgi:hypothetical protein